MFKKLAYVPRVYTYRLRRCNRRGFFFGSEQNVFHKAKLKYAFCLIKKINKIAL